MNELRLACRNLTRHRRRSAATGAAVALSAAGLLLFGGYVTWAHRGSVSHGTVLFGSFQVFRRGFHEQGAGNPAACTIPNYEEMRQALLADAELAATVELVTGRLVFPGLVVSAEHGTSASFLGTGVVPADHNRLLDWNPYRLTDVRRLAVNRALFDGGPELDPADPEGGTLGAGLARILGVRAAAGGERPAVELLCLPPGGGLPNVVTMPVRKSVPRGLEQLDDTQVVLPLAHANALLFPGEALRVTSLVVLVRHPRDTAAARVRVEAIARERGWGIETRGIGELCPTFRSSVLMMDLFFAFAFVIVAVVLVFTIYNTVVMGIVERTREIGTLRAMGVTRAAVTRLFLWEGTLLGAAGGLLGLVLAVAAAGVVNAATITYQPPTLPFRTKLEVRVIEEPGLVAGALAACLLVALAASWFPARRAARMAVVDALRA